MAENLNDEQRQAVEDLAWRLRIRGLTFRRIAEEIAKSEKENGLDLILSVSSVYEAVQRAERKLHAGFVTEAHLIKVEQTFMLDHIQEEAMEAWESSKDPAEMERIVDSDEHGKTTTTETRPQVGDPRFLKIAEDAMADKRKIWGADAPVKQDITSGGERLPIIGIEIIPPAGAAAPQQ